jgi:hypothetical protein
VVELLGLTSVAECPDQGIFRYAADGLVCCVAFLFGLWSLKVALGPSYLQRVCHEAVVTLAAAVAANDKVSGPQRRPREDEVLSVDILCGDGAHGGLGEAMVTC